jgi:two-component system invasion response regulator UvrY
VLTREMKDVVCGEAQNAQQVVDQVRAQHWDLAVLDITMPGRSGLAVLEELKQMQPELPVLVLSMHPEEQFGKRVLKAGASGYMTKESAPEELIKAVRKALAGGRYISAALAERLALDLTAGTEFLHDSLSDRELEVLRMIGSGRTISQIAEELHLAVATVSTYRVRILDKLKLNTTAEIIRYAIANDLVS